MNSYLMPTVRNFSWNSDSVFVSMNEHITTDKSNYTVCLSKFYIELTYDHKIFMYVSLNDGNYIEHLYDIINSPLYSTVDYCVLPYDESSTESSIKFKTLKINTTTDNLYDILVDMYQVIRVASNTKKENESSLIYVDSYKRFINSLNNIINKHPSNLTWILNDYASATDSIAKFFINNLYSEIDNPNGELRNIFENASDIFAFLLNPYIKTETKNSLLKFYLHMCGTSADKPLILSTASFSDKINDLALDQDKTDFIVNYVILKFSEECGNTKVADEDKIDNVTNFYQIISKETPHTAEYYVLKKPCSNISNNNKNTIFNFELPESVFAIDNRYFLKISSQLEEMFKLSDTGANWKLIVDTSFKLFKDEFTSSIFALDIIIDLYNSKLSSDNSNLKIKIFDYCFSKFTGNTKFEVLYAYSITVLRIMENHSLSDDFLENHVTDKLFKLYNANDPASTKYLNMFLALVNEKHSDQYFNAYSNEYASIKSMNNFVKYEKEFRSLLNNQQYSKLTNLFSKDPNDSLFNAFLFAGMFNSYSGYQDMAFVKKQLPDPIINAKGESHCLSEKSVTNLYITNNCAGIASTLSSPIINAVENNKIKSDEFLSLIVYMSTLNIFVEYQKAISKHLEYEQTSIYDGKSSGIVFNDDKLLSVYEKLLDFIIKRIYASSSSFKSRLCEFLTNQLRQCTNCSFSKKMAYCTLHKLNISKLSDDEVSHIMGVTTDAKHSKYSYASDEICGLSLNDLTDLIYKHKDEMRPVIRAYAVSSQLSE